MALFIGFLLGGLGLLVSFSLWCCMVVASRAEQWIEENANIWQKKTNCKEN